MKLDITIGELRDKTVAVQETKARQRARDQQIETAERHARMAAIHDAVVASFPVVARAAADEGKNECLAYQFTFGDPDWIDKQGLIEDLEPFFRARGYTAYIYPLDANYDHSKRYQLWVGWAG